MRKYKKCIQIGDNVTDIMRLPCVVDVRKCDDKCGMTWLEYDLADGGICERTDWLMLDVCDNWHCMSNEEYEQHKDDEDSYD